MKTLEGLQIGSDQWLAVRRQYLCASEAAAAMGYDKNVSRSELLRMKATGSEREFSDWAQKNLIDRGHEVEAAARSIAERIVGDDLYVVVGVLELDGLPLLASFDGVVMDESVIWECKSRNKSLLAALEAGDLPDSHWPQVEQQLLISGADKALFTPTDGTEEGTVKFWYASHPDRRAALLACLRQFQIDRAAYQYVEVIPAAVAAPTMQLPALSIQVNGEIALVDNLKLFGEGLKTFIARLPEKPSTDQEFADCKAACKTLQEAQDALDAAEAHALGQIASFDKMKRTKALLFDLARNTRLAVEKLVVAREQQIKVEIRQAGNDAFALHIANLNTRIGKPYLGLPIPDFAGAMKGKRTIASLHDAVDTLLATSKIAANEIADRIGVNMNALREHAKDHAFLFADTPQIVLKDTDVVENIIKIRIMEHRESEAKRLDAERERIRIEEIAKLERERIAKENAAAQKPMPDTERGTTVDTGNQSTGRPANAGNERPSGGLSLNISASAASTTRPSDTAIIHAVAMAFQTDDAMALEWLIALFAREAA